MHVYIKEQAVHYIFCFTIVHYPLYKRNHRKKRKKTPANLYRRIYRKKKSTERTFICNRALFSK